ncbi:DNA polymerase III subunit gamma/tau [Motilimonas sp. KMU-193]|uniref:DNA polymerase III subunit gamma/tau n=1 Tax=Motilimonas sp. KMU-193 TaxID=3388668 RepID=UPI00396B0BCB
MSYQVLARKWRPHNFSQVVGQQHVLTALINALDQNRLHHAYLFSGTRGVGKTSIARILAKSLNCEEGVTSTPCGVCHHCQAIDEGRFVDLLEIDAASRTKVEDTRELLDNVQYKPAQGRYKVYLIDEVHMLSKSSFNALLKTLEEPPEYVKFLLATTDPQKLPITILSRCLQFHLKSLNSEAIHQQLAYILDQEQHSYEQGALQALAKAAQGSMRDALSLTDQAIAFGNGVVNYQPVLAMLGTLDHHQVIQLLHFVAAGDAAKCLQKVAELVSLGPDFALVHNELAATLHQVALAHMLPSTLNALDDSEPIRVLSEQLSPEQVQLYYQIAIKGKQDLPLAPEPRIGLEMTLLRMLAFHPLTTSARAAHAAAGQRVQNNPVKVDATAPIATTTPKVQDIVSPAVTTDNAVIAAPQPNANQAMAQTQEQTQTQPDTPALRRDDAVEPLNQAQSPEPLHAETAYAEAANVIEASPAMTTASAVTTNTSNEPVTTAATGLTGVLEKRNMLRSRKLALESGKAKAKPIVAAPIAENPSAENPSAAPAPQAEPAQAQQMAPQPTPVSPMAQPNIAPNTTPITTPNSAQNTAANTAAPTTEVDLPWETDEPKQVSAPTTMTALNPAPSSAVEQGPPDYGDLPPIEAYGNDYAQYFETPDYSYPHEMDARADFEPAGQGEPMLAQDIAQSPNQDLHAEPNFSEPRGELNTRAEIAPSTAQQSRQAPEPLAPADMPRQSNADQGAVANATSALPTSLAMAEFEIPSGFSPQNNDPWCRLIDKMGLGGILRQLALNSVLLDANLAQASQLRLLLQPTSAHLDNDKNYQQLLQAVQKVLPQIQSVEIQIGQDANLATPIEIEQQIYLARLAQAKIDIQQDEAVNFFIARFGATVDEASIKPK